MLKFTGKESTFWSWRIIRSIREWGYSYELMLSLYKQTWADVEIGLKWRIVRELHSSRILCTENNKYPHDFFLEINVFIAHRKRAKTTKNKYTKKQGMVILCENLQQLYFCVVKDIGINKSYIKYEAWVHAGI